ncbi:uncharacterized protein LOC111070428 [Drosophila obscura]|uniref:uncharacterized protein LOC111070428 n=1 Tax=Drosophila obscura TaxID=7282 RepID=UPI001BB19958|nr:uncharacterized protein LOC111070428 [Drosophila obscura]
MQDQGQWRRQCIQRSRSRWNHHPPPYTNNQTSDAIMTFDAFPHGQKDLIMRCRQEEATASANWKPPAQYKTLAETLASMEEPFSEPTEEILNLSRQNFPPLPKPQNR